MKKLRTALTILPLILFLTGCNSGDPKTSKDVQEKPDVIVKTDSSSLDKKTNPPSLIKISYTDNKTKDFLLIKGYVTLKSEVKGQPSFSNLPPLKHKYKLLVELEKISDGMFNLTILDAATTYPSRIGDIVFDTRKDHITVDQTSLTRSFGYEAEYNTPDDGYHAINIFKKIKNHKTPIKLLENGEIDFSKNDKNWSEFHIDGRYNPSEWLTFITNKKRISNIINYSIFPPKGEFNKNESVTLKSKLGLLNFYYSYDLYEIVFSGNLSKENEKLSIESRFKSGESLPFFSRLNYESLSNKTVNFQGQKATINRHMNDYTDVYRLNSLDDFYSW